MPQPRTTEVTIIKTLRPWERVNIVASATKAVTAYLSAVGADLPTMRYVAGAWWLATAGLVGFIGLFFPYALVLAAVCLVVARLALVEHRLALTAALLVWLASVVLSVWWIAGPNELDDLVVGIAVLSTGAVIASAALSRSGSVQARPSN
jgi:hypothetical protein